MTIHNLFLDNEIEDAQLRMIFTACHPKLNPKDQISFALKTVSGFSQKEIASALLIKEETVKSDYQGLENRFRKKIFRFKFPSGKS